MFMKFNFHRKIMKIPYVQSTSSRLPKLFIRSVFERILAWTHPCLTLRRLRGIPAFGRSPPPPAFGRMRFAHHHPPSRASRGTALHAVSFASLGQAELRGCFIRDEHIC